MLLSVLGRTIDVAFDESISPADAERIERAWARCVIEATDAVNESPILVRVGVQDPVTITSDSASHSDRENNVENREADRQETEPERIPIISSTLEQLEQDIASRLTLLGIEARRRDLLMWHAVGLSDEAGRVAILSAPSGTGKTTAARTLGRHFGYVSDETVAVTPSGTIEPYPKPLSVITQSGQPKTQLGPDELHLRTPSSGLRPTVLAILTRDADHAGAPTVQPVPTVEALFELVPQISYLSETPGAVQSVLHVIESCGGVLRVTYAESADLVPVLAELLSGAADRDPVAVQSVPLPIETRDVSERVEGDILHLADEVVDAVEVDGDLVVLANGQLLRLAGLGDAIFRSLDVPRDADGLFAEFIAETEAADLLELRGIFDRAVETLRDNHVISR